MDLSNICDFFSVILYFIVRPMRKKQKRRFCHVYRCLHSYMFTRLEQIGLDALYYK